MYLNISGAKCGQCGKFFEDPHYLKDKEGYGLYWANPKICQYTDVRVDFCGPKCANVWWAGKMGAGGPESQSTQSKSLEQP